MPLPALARRASIRDSQDVCEKHLVGKYAYFDAPRGTHTVIAQLCGLVCRIPTLKDHFERRRQINFGIRLKPFSFHQSAAERSGSLLILASKVIFALNFPQPRKDLQRFALRM